MFRTTIRMSACLWLLAALGAQAQEAILPLDGPPSPKQKAFLERAPREKHVRRMGAVKLDRELLQAAAFDLRLFDMAGVKATRQRIERAGEAVIHLGTLSRGRVRGEYLVSFHADDVYGKFTLGGETYTIRSLGDGEYVLKQSDPASLPGCGNGGG